jgi:leucyl-tRNA synthetase
MELTNAIYEVKADPEAATDDEKLAVREAITAVVLMLTPFAPHTSEELFSVLVGNENGILANSARFPDYREDLAQADEIEIAVQVNGKLRSRVFTAPETSSSELETVALADPKVREHTDGKQIVKIVVVPNRLVNVVVKG